MSKQTNSKTIKTSIGGQAMRGPKLTALSVRMPDQSISTETWDTPNSNKWYKKTPFIRGVFNFVESLTDGYKSLMKAAEKAGLDDEEEEPSKFEQKLRQLLGDKFMPFLHPAVLAGDGTVLLCLSSYHAGRLFQGLHQPPAGAVRSGRIDQNCHPHPLPCADFQHERHQAGVHVPWSRAQDHLLL